jgi:hypothetical protein
MKRIEQLEVQDFKRHPVWALEINEDDAFVYVSPVLSLPVNSLNGRIIGVETVLNSGLKLWCHLGNVDTVNPSSNEHFVSASFYVKGKWHRLSRYHDFDATAHGPKNLADVLNLSIEEVFPITYDLTPYVNASVSVTNSVIDLEPSVLLSRGELIALAVS